MSYSPTSHASSASSDGSREPRPNPNCEICNGTGVYTEERMVEMSDECRNCDGKGWYPTFGGLGALRLTCCSGGNPDCEYCGHRNACGWFEADTCGICEGEGVERWEDTEIVSGDCDCAW